MGESPNKKLRGLAPQANPGPMFPKYKNFPKSFIKLLGLIYKKRDNCYWSFFFGGGVKIKWKKKKGWKTFGVDLDTELHSKNFSYD